MRYGSVGLFGLAVGLAAGVQAQEPPGSAVTALRSAHEAVADLAAGQPDGIWPGFRPDTIPVLYVLPGQGTALFGWDGRLPEGFEPVVGVPGGGWMEEAERGAASTARSLEGRGVAQVVVSTLERSALVGATIHEQFHVFQSGVRRPDRRFGQGENSFLVSRYPEFDVENEAGFALEGRLLGAALEAEDADRARELAHQFIAVREARQRRLDAELREFEAATELNEGLAQYVAVRGLRILASGSEGPWGEETVAEARRMLGDLTALIGEGRQSLRLRFYRTGAAQALLLDRLAGPGWKTRLMEENLTLQDALAEFSGYRERERSLVYSAKRVFRGGELALDAAGAVAERREARQARADSALSRPGFTMVIEARALSGLGLCGIDPQNLLQVDEDVLLHTRWLVACSGSALRAEFTAPVVHDRSAHTLRAVVGEPTDVKVSAAGAPVELIGERRLPGARDVRVDAPGLTLQARRADLEFSEGRLVIRPLPR